VRDIFLKKTGIVTQRIAGELVSLKKGDKIPTTSELQNRCVASRGTIQNALAFFKEQGAITCANRGHLGIFLLEIDHGILQSYAVSSPIVGTMPLPYSRRYEGLATGLNDAFKKYDISLNMSYMRGARERINLVCSDMCGFAIVSHFAALEAIAQNKPIKIAMNFGEYSYLSRHVLIFKDPDKKQIEAGMKVGIDHCSHDHVSLTHKLMQGLEVELVEMPSHRLISELRKGEVDAGVWNHDEIIDKNYHDLHCVFLEERFNSEEMNAAAMVCKNDDSAMAIILKNNPVRDDVLKIQQEVMSGQKTPCY